MAERGRNSFYMLNLVVRATQMAGKVRGKLWLRTAIFEVSSCTNGPLRRTRFDDSSQQADQVCIDSIKQVSQWATRGHSSGEIHEL